jgi:predicted enzyme related to lactoylglutathione lyase
MHGQFIWYELTTPDVDAAQKFYPRFTGWGTQPFDAEYMMWTTDGVPFAGVSRLSEAMAKEGVPPNWLAYIEADDVDLTVKKAEAIGAKVVTGPGDIPGAGRYAVLTDPQGAMFGVYKSTNPLGGAAWDGIPVLGRFSWHELMTNDSNQALEFYCALFDWEKMGVMDMGGGLMYHMVGTAGEMYGGVFDTPKEMAGMHPFWLLYINVEDVGKAVKTATKAGATVQRPQMDIPGGSIAILGDPQGAGFAVHHVNAPAAAAAPTKKKAGATSRAKTAVKKAAKKAAKRVAKTAGNARKAVKKAAKKVVARAKKAAKRVAKKAPVKKAARKVKTASKAGAKRVARRVTTRKTRRSAKKTTRR